MPQHVNHRSFVKGEPRAILAGRKGGLNRKGCGWRSADYIKGYAAGARNARRHIQRWIDERPVFIVDGLLTIQPRVASPGDAIAAAGRTRKTGKWQQVGT
jgi:hypothetical protein